ncbi:hypothetical protein ILYODFUR_029617, partial [Ilyodon furcidens]
DKDFEKQNLFQAHSNPPAEVSSSMKHYQEHSLDRLYKGDDFMWALSPVQGDYILISFPQPIHISGSVVLGFFIMSCYCSLYPTLMDAVSQEHLGINPGWIGMKV